MSARAAKAHKKIAEVAVGEPPRSNRKLQILRWAAAWEERPDANASHEVGILMLDRAMRGRYSVGRRTMTCPRGWRQ